MNQKKVVEINVIPNEMIIAIYCHALYESSSKIMLEDERTCCVWEAGVIFKMKCSGLKH